MQLVFSGKQFEETFLTYDFYNQFITLDEFMLVFRVSPYLLERLLPGAIAMEQVLHKLPNVVEQVNAGAVNVG